MSIADGVFQLGPGDLKYQQSSDARLKVNILIEVRNYKHANQCYSLTAELWGLGALKTTSVASTYMGNHLSLTLRNNLYKSD